jgi:hypothetical protein
MPWIVVACAWLLGACFFDADYGSGRVKCSDGKCPSGLSCESGTCVARRQDAATDGVDDAAIDARVAALTCADAGVLMSSGDSATGTTAGRSSTISAMCGGFVMNGADAVYRISTAASDQLLVSISGSFAASAYVIAPCSVSPATPACLTNTAATAGNPVAVTTATAGAYFVIVDATNAAQAGDYTLTVTVN